MAKGNQKAASNSDIQKLKSQYNQFINIQEDMADACESIMPLAAASIRLTIKIIKMYKKAFVEGLNYAPKRK